MASHFYWQARIHRRHMNTFENTFIWACCDGFSPVHIKYSPFWARKGCLADSTHPVWADNSTLIGSALLLHASVSQSPRSFGVATKRCLLQIASPTTSLCLNTRYVKSQINGCYFSLQITNVYHCLTHTYLFCGWLIRKLLNSTPNLHFFLFEYFELFFYIKIKSLCLDSVYTSI